MTTERRGWLPEIMAPPIASLTHDTIMDHENIEAIVGGICRRVGISNNAIVGV